ncbi:hypothetical protein GCM10010503_23460 [Streptomyces lucensis JCM 4490]|uniref:Uncharacterized protein n=1 Tax=Streptomyces lucensis JCM 4490 TaxID=1306176 RepID=A0A918J3K5_9ACTN|nr:hypothetical protein GCM10010503_23460 [Streptomyces lucensis JCM 4490]
MYGGAAWRLPRRIHCSGAPTAHTFAQHRTQEQEISRLSAFSRGSFLIDAVSKESLSVNCHRIPPLIRAARTPYRTDPVGGAQWPLIARGL